MFEEGILGWMADDMWIRPHPICIHIGVAPSKMQLTGLPSWSGTQEGVSSDVGGFPPRQYP
jgi:hypothetical protein